MGPILARELITLPRRGQFYVWRAVYPTALLVVLSTAWLMLAGAQRQLGVGDVANFSSMAFPLLAILQVTVVLFASAVLAASSVAQEKDRKTLVLLLVTRLNRLELVWGKLFGSLLELLSMVLAGLPVFALMVLLGGVSLGQVARVFAVTVMSALAAGSLGVVVAYWREKTFQTLSLVVLCLCFWIGAAEWVATWGVRGGDRVDSISQIAAGLQPIRAVLAAARPFQPADPRLGFVRTVPQVFFSVATVVFALLSAVGILRVRTWNRGDHQESALPADRKGRGKSLAEPALSAADPGSGTTTASARDLHIDARKAPVATDVVRTMWDNPVLWRECVTWAYGRKVILIRVAYLVLAACIMAVIHHATGAVEIRWAQEQGSILPVASQPLATLYLISLAILNALAVTSITSERDGGALDMLLATDLSPREFIFGKLLGIGSVAGLMVLTPMAISCYAWWRGAMPGSSLLYLVCAFLTLDLFAMMLGIHCGIRYANSRTAIGVSMGTLFGLSLGVATCMLMMVAFSNSFHVQLVPFTAIILGGGVGLYVALTAGDHSTAMGIAAGVVPFASFYVLTCLMLRQALPAFLVTVICYGFATASMMVPALSQFDFAMGRSTAAGE